VTTLPSVGATAGAGSPPAEALAPYVAAGLLGPTACHVATTVARLVPGLDTWTVLALAAATQAPVLGHVRLELDAVGELLATGDAGADGDAAEVAPLAWPDPVAWAGVLARSPVVSRPEDAARDPDPIRPLVLDGRSVYLQRLWRAEVDVAAALLARASLPEHPVASGCDEVLDALFPPAPVPAGPGEAGTSGGGRVPDDLQRRAARLALSARVSVIAGGPGTGKTRTVARLLAAEWRLAAAEGRAATAALAAPTGKAAARLTTALHAAVDEARGEGVLDEAVAAELGRVEATTVHRLVGRPAGSEVPRHARRLPHDLVVVDETSMVSLPVLARLVHALRPDARLVLVGDPSQLASVEAGTVMRDLVGTRAAPPERDDDRGRLPVTVLERVHRFGAGSGIAALAGLVRRGDIEGALGALAAGSDDVTWVQPGDRAALSGVVARAADAALEIVARARAGDVPGALESAGRLKVLTATRHGPFGLSDWSSRIEEAIVAAGGERAGRGRYPVGTPVLVTRNDPLERLANGDAGVVVRAGALAVLALPDGPHVRTVPVARLPESEPWWAMTVHKSQGSEFDDVVVSLPRPGSPVLTRELVYTALTRARRTVTVVADEASLRTAVSRSAVRASGLGERLWGG
jgi:exodeoxyribonuclease V alpha subunit